MRPHAAQAVVAFAFLGCGGKVGQVDILRCNVGRHEVTLEVPHALAMTHDDGASSAGDAATIEKHVVFRDKARTVEVAILLREFKDKPEFRAPQSATLKVIKDGMAKEKEGPSLIEGSIRTINGLDCIVLDIRGDGPGDSERTVSAMTDLDDGALCFECTYPVATETSFAAIAQQILASLKVVR